MMFSSVYAFITRPVDIVLSRQIRHIKKSLWPFPELIVDAWKIQIISGIYFAAEEAAEHDIKILTLLLTHICLLGMFWAVEPS